MERTHFRSLGDFCHHVEKLRELQALTHILQLSAWQGNGCAS